MDSASERHVFPRESCAWNLPPLSPIASASPESSNSACEVRTRYNPNLSEEEPLFSARIVSPASVSVTRQPRRKYSARKVQRQWRTSGRSPPCRADRGLVTLHRRPAPPPSPLDREPGLDVESLASLLPRQRALSVAEEWLRCRRRAPGRLSRRGRLALLCRLSLPLRLCLLGLLFQIRLHSVVGHSSCRTSAQLLVTGQRSAGATVERRRRRPVYDCCLSVRAVDGLLRSIGRPARRPSRSHTCR